LLFQIDEIEGQHVFDRLMEVHGNYERARQMRTRAMEIAWERFEAVAVATRRGLDENP
tara:strand:+ start:1976 stop:2149 length:174 start_codon:yes stop_codon:yes gene_type:complete